MPSINCWIAKNIGIAAKGISLRLARRSVTAPIVKSTKLAVKLALAEKQIVFTPDSRKSSRIDIHPRAVDDVSATWGHDEPFRKGWRQARFGEGVKLGPAALNIDAS